MQTRPHQLGAGLASPIANSALAWPPPIAPLPRGRHGIPPELVAANQRERLLRAATDIFASSAAAPSPCAA